MRSGAHYRVTRWQMAKAESGADSTWIRSVEYFQHTPYGLKIFRTRTAASKAMWMQRSLSSINTAPQVLAMLFRVTFNGSKRVAWGYMSEQVIVAANAHTTRDHDDWARHTLERKLATLRYELRDFHNENYGYREHRYGDPLLIDMGSVVEMPREKS